MGWTDVTLKVLERAMDASSLRNKLIVNNIANADTPGYKRKDISFQEELEKIIARGDDKGFAPRITTSNDLALRADGNNVDVEREMSELAKNNLYYQVLADQLDKQLKQIEKVISQAGQK
ncbi:MAG: flagellar basal body rod protein FlgB [Halanaerobium sp.]|nr:flagellar basal body rod protein FlgB [Halanaerobium sp.]